MLKFKSQTEAETNLSIGDLIRYTEKGKIEIIYKTEKTKQSWHIRYWTHILQDMGREYFYSSDWHTVFKIK